MSTCNTIISIYVCRRKQSNKQCLYIIKKNSLVNAKQIINILRGKKHPLNRHAIIIQISSIQCCLK